MRTRGRRSTRMMAAGIFAVAGLGLAGCGTEGPEEGPDVEDIAEEGDTGVPMGYVGPYDQAFYDERETYAGQEVTVSAEVTETLSTDAFVIAGTADTAVDPLLVVEEQDIPALDVGQVVEVTGTVQQDFDIAVAEEELGLELEDELYADYEGEPYITATSGEILEEE